LRKLDSELESESGPRLGRLRPVPAVGCPELADSPAWEPAAVLLLAELVAELELVPARLLPAASDRLDAIPQSRPAAGLEVAFELEVDADP
jgi:hypothetical protein